MKQSVVKLLKSARGHLLEYSNCQGAMVMLREGPGGPMVVRTVRGVDPAELGRKCCTSHLIAMVEKKGESVLVSDVRKDTRFQDKRQDFRAALCVPVIDRNKETIGILFALNRNQTNAFSGDEQSDAEQYAKTLARELERAKWDDFREDDPPPKKAPAEPSDGLTLKSLVPFILLAIVALGVMVIGISRGGDDSPPPPAPGSADAPTPQGFNAERMVVEGRLLNLDGKPLAGQSLEGLRLVVTLPKSRDVLTGKEIELKGDGRFRALCKQRVIPDMVEVRVEVPSFRVERRRIKVAGGRAQIGELTLTPRRDH